MGTGKGKAMVMPTIIQVMRTDQISITSMSTAVLPTSPAHTTRIPFPVTGEPFSFYPPPVLTYFPTRHDTLPFPWVSALVHAVASASKPTGSLLCVCFISKLVCSLTYQGPERTFAADIRTPYTLLFPSFRQVACPGLVLCAPSVLTHPLLSLPASVYSPARSTRCRRFLRGRGLVASLTARL